MDRPGWPEPGRSDRLGPVPRARGALDRSGSPVYVCGGMTIMTWLPAGLLFPLPTPLYLFLITIGVISLPGQCVCSGDVWSKCRERAGFFDTDLHSLAKVEIDKTVAPVRTVSGLELGHTFSQE